MTRQRRVEYSWTLLILGWFMGTAVMAQTPPQGAMGTMEAVAGARIKEIYRVGLKPGELLLESVKALCEREHITDGAVLTGIGSLSTARMHWPTTTKYPSVDSLMVLPGPLEILSIQGIIADGVPHLHMTVSTLKNAIGAHVEDGCRVLYLVEMTIVSYEGPAMTRRPNQYGTPMLGKK